MRYAARNQMVMNNIIHPGSLGFSGFSSRVLAVLIESVAVRIMGLALRNDFGSGSVKGMASL